jgi:ketosteroid isomerase-like protein
VKLGRSQIRDFFQGMIEAGVGELALESLKIDVSDDLAYNVGKYSLGKPAPDAGKFVEVHRRQPDGSWRCVADIFNSDQPAA